MNPDLPLRDEISVTVPSLALVAMARLASDDPHGALDHVLIETETDSTSGWLVAGNGKRMACWALDDVLDHEEGPALRLLVPAAMIDHLKLEAAPDVLVSMIYRPAAAKLSATVDLVEVSVPVGRLPAEYPIWQGLMDHAHAPAETAGQLVGSMNAELLRSFGDALRAAKVVMPETAHAFDLYRSGGTSGKIIAIHPECSAFRGVLMPIVRDDPQLTLPGLFGPRAKAS